MSKIAIDRAVVEQALEAFSGLLTYNTSNAEYAAGRLAVKSLQSALEQPQVEQSAGWKLVPTSMTDEMAAADKELRNAVPWVRWDAILEAAPQPSRQPLTEEEIRDLFQDQRVFPRLLKFIRVIEAAHGIGEPQ